MGKKRIIALVLAAACLLCAGGCGSGLPGVEKQDVSAAYLVSKAEYPEMAPYPNEADYYGEKSVYFDDEAFSAAYTAWRESRNLRRSYPLENVEGLDGFFRESARQFLSRSNGENRIYSPLNVYMALAMLAETSGGGSRQEILDLLGAESVEGLRAQAFALWNANYCDDGTVTSLLANSLWMNEGVSFSQETIKALAEHYYASVYQGEMGSAEFDKALQSWLNEQTGGLLNDQVSKVEMPPETILALASTICFRAKWSDEFHEGNTKEGRFSVLDADGATVPCDFMHRSDSRNYYWGDSFSAVSLPLRNSGQMWFLLPDGDVSVDALLADEEAMNFLRANGQWENSKFLTVNLSLPKFDVSSQLDLIPGLKAMGVQDVFDFETADFTPLIENDVEIAVTQAQHGARVRIDEEGCQAAAYTAMIAPGAAPPPEEEVDFVLDRPFLFAITSREGLPLFLGVVNRPV